ncbi:MAG: hypothetical protein KME17_08195 [Cyanosarcina radialis HA8281-LM2]|nr:hypothetical protein [Cyanosarcina radialis HA8281-LM2]
MPRALSWFNNSIDPLLPREVKPLLYNFDEYQTYDLITWQKTTTYLANAFPVCFPIPSLCDIDLSGIDRTIVLMERFTPWEFPWCINYADKLFRLVQTYSGTDYYRTNYINNVSHINIDYVRGIEVSIQYPLEWGNESPLSTINFNDYLIPVLLELTIPATPEPENIYLTWMERDDSFFYPRTNYLEYTKQYQIIQTKSTSFKYRFNIDIQKFLMCSLEISGSGRAYGQLISQIKTLKTKGILYIDLDGLIDKIHEHIVRNFPRLFKLVAAIDYTITSPANAIPTVRMDNTLDPLFIQYGNIFTINNITFRDRPDNYRPACLLRANNNYWQNGAMLPDLGKKPLFDSGGGVYLIKPCGYLPDTDRFNDGVNHSVLDFTGTDNANWRFYFSELAVQIPINGQYYLNHPSRPNFNYTYGLNLISHRSLADLLIKQYNSLLKKTLGLKYVDNFIISVSQDSGLFYEGGRDADVFTWKIVVEPTESAYVPNSTENVFNFIADEVTSVYSGIQNPSNMYLHTETITVTGTETYYYYLNDADLTTPWAGAAPQITDEQYLQLIDNRKYELDRGELAEFMPDSIRIKEIHAALQAEKFATDETSSLPRIANLGYYIERVARVLGISVNPDGSIKSIRQKGFVEPGEVIPAGWYFGQWGENEGSTHQPGASEGVAEGKRDGIVYENRSNRLILEGGTLDQPLGDVKNAVIKPGQYVLCENIPQLLDAVLDDLDAALNWQEAAAGYVPTPEGKPICLYEGMHSLIAEIAYMLSAMSAHTSEGYIAGLVTQQIAKEILQGLGLPIDVGKIEVDIGFDYPGEVPYPKLKDNSSTIAEQIGWVLANLSILVGQKIKLVESLPSAVEP